MSVRAIFLAWCGALGVIVTAAVTISGLPPISAPPDFKSVETVFLGSSLTRHAIPMPQDAPAPLVSRTGAYARIGLRAAEPTELEDLMEQALDEGAQRIVLELRPFLYRTRNQANITQCRGIRCQTLRGLGAASAEAMELRGQFRAWYRRALGVKPETDRIAFGQGDPEKLGKVFNPDQNIAHRYPLNLMRWRDDSRLTALVNRAHSQGTEVLFVVYPRAQAAHALIPQDQHRWLHSRVRKLSNDLGVETFKPADVWQNSDFHDGAHVNQAGRDRFARELAQWLADRS